MLKEAQNERILKIPEMREQAKKEKVPEEAGKSGTFKKTANHTAYLKRKLNIAQKGVLKNKGDTEK